MLWEILTALIDVAIATRIAQDWLRDVKKPPMIAASTTNGLRAKLV